MLQGSWRSTLSYRAAGLQFPTGAAQIGLFAISSRRFSLSRSPKCVELYLHDPPLTPHVSDINLRFRSTHVVTVYAHMNAEEITGLGNRDNCIRRSFTKRQFLLNPVQSAV